ncbi:calcium/manganese antiporter SLC30A10 isoform 1-T1 [Lycaon pictus]|uniref:zinc transporter 10 isoform X1 n=1 Tax=Canis lupus familiaris TaxID=9615 RepID=UPI0018F63597|nr:zinc transporter 10 isoform X1 [Canis lupus familiaris]XP_038320068.1 zinc transporter 10 isoform X1 [Canis lupus familiaris]
MGRYSGRSFRLILMCIVSILLFVMELVIANIGNSLSLASDAFAVLSHFLSMIIALFGVRVSSIKQHRKSTFGFLRADVVGAFGNSIFAVALMFSILVEAVKRYINPQKTEEPLLILSAGIIGLLFNILNYVILDCCYCTAHMPQGDTETGDSLNTQNEPEETMKKEKKSEALNIRGVLLHVMGDALGSVVVVITAIIFYVRPLQPEDPCNWQCYIDPSLTIIMVIIILSSAFPLIKETAAILLQMVPKGVNMEELMSKLSAVPGISSVHEVHIWELISGKIIATLHIKYQKDRDYQDASRKIREIFHSVGIHNVTIQFEQVDLKDPVEQKDLLLLCSSPCISKGCEKQLCCPPGALPLAHVNGCAEHNGCPPLDTYPSDGLRRRETTEVAIEVSLDSCLSEHGQAPSKSQEDPHYVNSTHF